MTLPPDDGPAFADDPVRCPKCKHMLAVKIIPSPNGEKLLWADHCRYCHPSRNEDRS